MTADAGTRRLILCLAVCLLVALTLAAVVHPQEYVLVTKWGSSGAGDGQFNSPYGIALDADANVYVADRGNHRIQKFDPNGTFLTKWGSVGNEDGQFQSPSDVAVGPSGTVYVVEMTGCRVQRFTLDGGFLGKWGSWGEGNGEFKTPRGVAVDGLGRVYVADQTNHCIQKFTPAGGFLRKWGSYGGADGEFRQPLSVAVHPLGNVYVADYDNYRVQKFRLNGTFLTKWGWSGHDDGEFDKVVGVAVDSSGHVYVADTLNRRIQKFTSTGFFITKWGGAYMDPSSLLTGPCGVAVDAWGNVYVSDRSADCIFKFAPVVHQPDMRARLSRDEPWRFNDRYGPARTQTLTTSVPAGGDQVFCLSVQNDSSTKQKIRVYGTGFDGRWTLTYSGRVDGEVVILTDAITGGGGWEVGPLGPGRQQVFQARMTTPKTAVGGSERSAVVRAVSDQDGSADAVKFVLRVRKFRKPDARIKLPSERRWTGDDVYDANAKGQIRRRSVPSERNAIYHLSFQNDGNARESFKITGPKTNARWRIRYFAALSGGTNVTPEVTGGGWTTPSLKPGEAQEMLLSVTPRTDFEGDRKAVTVTAASTSKSWVKDAVKAITIVESTSAAACQVTSLCAAPTRAGAQLTFTLASDARVTATVLNVAGRPIKTIVADKPLAAGVQTLLWNRTSDAGLAVPHGTYLLRVVARDEAGREASALATLAVK